MLINRSQYYFQSKTKLKVFASFKMFNEIEGFVFSHYPKMLLKRAFRAL